MLCLASSGLLFNRRCNLHAHGFECVWNVLLFKFSMFLAILVAQRIFVYWPRIRKNVPSDWVNPRSFVFHGYSLTWIMVSFSLATVNWAFSFTIDYNDPFPSYPSIKLLFFNWNFLPHFSFETLSWMAWWN